jgi:hypothetical protein
MSNNTEVPVTTTPQTSHLDEAIALIDDIRAMKQRVPNFVVPESKNAGRQLAAAASVPPQFVDLAALAIRNNDELTRGGNSGSVQMRDKMDFADAYDPVADELEALAHFIRHSVRVARNSAGSNALMTYSMARRLAKRPETASLAPHVADMKSALGPRGRKAKAKPAPTPATPVSSDPDEPSPVTPTSPVTAPKTTA